MSHRGARNRPCRVPPLALAGLLLACGPTAAGPSLEVEYGGCSAVERDSVCPSHCEMACLVDDECGEGLVCNAPVICGESNGGEMGPPLACAGWCVPEL